MKEAQRDCRLLLLNERGNLLSNVRMNKKSRILGLEDLDTARSKSHSRKVKEGIQKREQKKLRKRLRYIKTREKAELQGTPWSEYQWGTERLRGLKAQSRQKGKYRKKAEKLAYLLFGVVKPRKLQGNHSRHYEEWELKMNFITQGWDPWTGSIDPDSPFKRGRWDLDVEDWKKLWSNFPDSLRNSYRIRRINPEESYTYENLIVERLPKKGN